MADSAHPILYRFMLRYRALLALDRVRMALPAEPHWRVLQEPGLRRRVWTVTIDAPLFPQNRLMEAVLGEHLVNHCIVASPAQFETLLLQGERIRRVGALMAEIARFVGKRGMGRVIDEARLIGAVHIMAEGATGISHGIVHVLFGKDRLISLVALLAERRHFFFQESGGLH